MMTPVSSVNKAYSMLVERENQRAIVNSATNSEVIGMTTLMTGAAGTSSKQKQNWNLICDFSKKKKKKGHTKVECYKTVGYPANFNFRFKKKIDPAAAHNVVVPGE